MSPSPHPQGCDAPFFVIGNPRSGTTLLRLLLTCNNELVVPPEGAFVVGLQREFGSFRGARDDLPEFVIRLLAYPTMDTWCFDPRQLLDYLVSAEPQCYRDLCCAVYRAYGEGQGKSVRYWGDKNNSYIRHIDSISRLFPTSRFIHIVRDGRDVACSYRALRDTNGRHAPRLPTSIYSAARHWRDNLSEINRHLQGLDSTRTLEMRYEDLLADPESTLQGICSYLNVSYDDRMLQFHKVNLKKGLEPTEFLNWKQLTTSPLSNESAGRWRKEMFDEDIYLFQLVAREALERFGYAVANGPRFRLLDLYVKARGAARYANRLKVRLSRVFPRNIDG
jgi:hypothetical protein